MADRIFQNEWVGDDDGDRTLLKIENDCMEPGAPEVITIEIENESKAPKGEPGHWRTWSLACLTAEEARQAAYALMAYAFMVDKHNREAGRGDA